MSVVPINTNGHHADRGIPSTTAFISQSLNSLHGNDYWETRLRSATFDPASFATSSFAGQTTQSPGTPRTEGLTFADKLGAAIGTCVACIALLMVCCCCRTRRHPNSPPRPTKSSKPTERPGGSISSPEISEKLPDTNPDDVSTHGGQSDRSSTSADRLSNPDSDRPSHPSGGAERTSEPEEPPAGHDPEESPAGHDPEETSAGHDPEETSAGHDPEEPPAGHDPVDIYEPLLFPAVRRPDDTQSILSVMRATRDKKRRRRENPLPGMTAEALALLFTRRTELEQSSRPSGNRPQARDQEQAQGHANTRSRPHAASPSQHSGGQGALPRSPRPGHVDGRGRPAQSYPPAQRHPLAQGHQHAQAQPQQQHQQNRNLPALNLQRNLQNGTQHAGPRSPRGPRSPLASRSGSSQRFHPGHHQDQNRGTPPAQ